MLDIYTDGACSGNPGKGGYAYCVVHDGNIMHKSSCANKYTTNNKEELRAVIRSIQWLTKNDICDTINIYSDSSYVVDSITKKWIDNWRKKNWVKSNGDDVANKDLWLEYIEARKECKSRIRIIKVKGHAGNPYNEFCDRLAVKAYKSL